MGKTDALDIRGLPQSIPTEKVVLGLILNGSLDFSVCRSVLDASDYALEAHRVIYGRMEVLAGEGRRIDLVTVSESLIRASELEQAGGLAAISNLTSGLPQLAQADEYIGIVKRKSILRKTVTVADQIRSAAILETEDATELLSRAERMLVELGIEASSDEEYRTAGEVIMLRGGLQKYLERGKTLGIPTGFPTLDRLTCGMRPKQLWVLAAATGGGKSTFARAIAMHAARANYPGAFITMEMSDDEVVDGLICSLAPVDSQVIRRGLPQFDAERIRWAANAAADAPLYIRDRAQCTIPQLHGSLRKLKAERGIEWAVVDYIQLMTPTGKFGTRSEAVGSLSRGLKMIASDLNICVIGLSQIGREGIKAARKPELSDLRESGSIEQDANVVMFLWSDPNNQNQIVETEVLVKKQRGGANGNVNMLFDKRTGNFTETENQREIL